MQGMSYARKIWSGDFFILVGDFFSIFSVYFSQILFCSVYWPMVKKWSLLFIHNLKSCTHLKIKKFSFYEKFQFLLVFLKIGKISILNHPNRLNHGTRNVYFFFIQARNLHPFEMWKVRFFDKDSNSLRFNNIIANFQIIYFLWLTRTLHEKI